MTVIEDQTWHQIDKILIDERPLPLVMLEEPCAFRRAALAALDEAGIPWRIVLVSASLAAVRAAVGAGLGITSDDFFELRSRPSRVFIAGSGYVAVELAGVLQALDTEVTLLCRHEHPLRHFDELLGSLHA